MVNRKLKEIEQGRKSATVMENGLSFDIKREISDWKDGMILIRREFHEYPELGFREHATGQIVADMLELAGLKVKRCAGTGVVAVLEGKNSGKTVMLRCELDALPVTEENELPFKSKKPGVMHACGHDVNIAVQIVVAMILAEHAEEIPGTVMFVFQPNEEDCGAPYMIEDGVFNDCRPDAIFAPHIWSQLPFGTVGVADGAMCASSYYFDITVKGKDTSAYSPYNGVNPINAAGRIIEAVDTMITAECDMLNEPTLINVCMVHGGDFPINIPETVKMQGSIRCLHKNEKTVHKRFQELVKKVCDAYRCSCDIKIKFGNNLLENDASLCEVVKRQAENVEGIDRVIEEGAREFGGDDLAEFFREGIPGVYYLVGMGDAEKKTDAPHHSKDFLVDEDAIALQAELQLRCVLDYLGVEVS